MDTKYSKEAKMFKVHELDINDYIGYAKSHIGETHDVHFKHNDMKAGEFTILDFEPLDNPHFGYHYWKHEEDKTPDHAKLGYYFVKFNGTKWYNGKIIKTPVVAYVQSEYTNEGKAEPYKTKALCIYDRNAETGKALKAYDFGILDFMSRVD